VRLKQALNLVLYLIKLRAIKMHGAVEVTFSFLLTIDKGTATGFPSGNVLSILIGWGSMVSIAGLDNVTITKLQPLSIKFRD
jgi:hypothetical protein